jgi:hypothetical protein
MRLKRAQLESIMTLLEMFERDASVSQERRESVSPHRLSTPGSFGSALLTHKTCWLSVVSNVLAEPKPVAVPYICVTLRTRAGIRVEASVTRNALFKRSCRCGYCLGSPYTLCRHDICSKSDMHAYGPPNHLKHIAKALPRLSVQLISHENAREVRSNASAVPT